MRLFKSNHFALTEIRRSGKKNTSGILCFEGLPSVFGSKHEVLALEDGVVLRAGRCTDPCSREKRTGTFVCISGHCGVNIIYGRLACRYVKTGDYVRAGECIGIEGSSGSGNGEYLTLEFRRNGRRVDGCEYLGIADRTAEFTPQETNPSEIVTKVCSLSDEMRSFLDSSPLADQLWRKLLAHLGTETEPTSSPENSPKADYFADGADR